MTGKQIAAIALLAVGLVSAVFGVFGLVGGGDIEPYEARQGIVLVYAVATVYNEDGTVEQTGGTGTGWAVGKPGEPVQYIVTNGHVVEAAYTYPKTYSNVTIICIGSCLWLTLCRLLFVRQVTVVLTGMNT